MSDSKNFCFGARVLNESDAAWIEQQLQAKFAYVCELRKIEKQRVDDYNDLRAKLSKQFKKIVLEIKSENEKINLLYDQKKKWRSKEALAKRRGESVEIPAKLLDGIVIVKDDQIGAWGDIELVALESAGVAGR
jgi:cell shape-determining protein MreC